MGRLVLPRVYQRQLDDEVAAVVRMAANPDAPDPEPASQAAERVSLPERVWHGFGRLFRGGRESQSR